jgi:hypothetical protein
MTNRPITILFLATILSACSTGDGGTVLPSPIGDSAVGKACRAAAPDVIPVTPFLMNSIWMSEGRGSAADALEALRMGFERVSFDVTPAHLTQASGLPLGDTSRWSLAPLTTQAGAVTLEVVRRGDPRCAAFEAEVQSQRNSSDPKANTDDPMKHWTDTRFPSAPPEGRNWCVATMGSADFDAARYTRTVTNSQEGQSTVTVAHEILAQTIAQATGNLMAQRTLVRMYRPSFPIGISSVATGCDGRTIGPTSEFFGPTSIAVRPANAPTLINK